MPATEPQTSAQLGFQKEHTIVTGDDSHPENGIAPGKTVDSPKQYGS